MKTGRPTKYKPDFARMAEVACREGGFSDAKLAKLLGISKSCLAVFKNEYPEFMDSIKRGKEDYDSDQIEKSLARRATGYQYNEVEKKRFAKKDEDGNIVGHELKITKITKKEMAPDTGACALWLMNRRHPRWQDKRHVQLSGEVATTTTLSPELQALVERLKP